MTSGAEGEILLDRAAQLMDRELGLRPDPSLRSRLDRSLRDEAAARGEDLAGYVATLDRDRGARQSLFDRLTVQETAFFRHPGQFEALAEHVLPGIVAPVLIWSAASSNGQEPYSLAMVLEEQAVPGSVIATDVSTRALQRTSEGVYRSQELTGLSSPRRERFLTSAPADDRWQVRKALRDRLTVQHHNLITDRLPDFVERCQVVFCRNVLIYFSPEHAAAFLTRLAAKLPPGACLFLGYAETIWQVTDLFEPVRIGDAFEYHRRRSTPVIGPRSSVKAAPSPEVARPRRAAGSPRPRRRSVPVIETAVAGGDPAGSDPNDVVGACRRIAYLEPDQPIAHLHLGLALEAAGDWPSARRAYRAARSALGRSDPAAVASGLGGYRVEELIRLLDAKQEGGPA
jgi:chemotaxis protein methyltransferase CheR